MDERVLVVHAGRYGSTAEVAEVVAEELRRCGATVDASPATEGIRLEAYDAIVVGSAIYWEHLLPEAARFIEQNREALGRKRVACFVLCMELTRVTEGPGLGVPVTIDPLLGSSTPRPGEARLLGTGRTSCRPSSVRCSTPRQRSARSAWVSFAAGSTTAGCASCTSCS